jgi:hypothetical protein
MSFMMQHYLSSPPTISERIGMGGTSASTSVPYDEKKDDETQQDNTEEGGNCDGNR